MDKKTVGIIATVLTALICGCTSIFTCVWGVILAAEVPFDTEFNGVESVQTFPPTIGYVLLCLTVILLLVPVAVGFFTLRVKPEGNAPPAVVDAETSPEPVEPVDDEPLPPASPPAE
jgi:hypothetical protein